MEMKWNPIVNGDVSKVPIGEELLFTVLDEDDGETYATSCWTEEGYDGKLIARAGCRYFGAECLTAWMDMCELCGEKLDCRGGGWDYDGNKRADNCPLMEVEDE